MIICMFEIISILIKSYNVGIMWLMNIHDSWYEMMQLSRIFNISFGCFDAMYIMPPRDFELGVRIDVHNFLSPNRRLKENCGFGLSTIHWTLASASALSPPSLNCEAVLKVLWALAMLCRLREVQVSLSGPLYSILCCGKKDPKKTVAQREECIGVSVYSGQRHLMPFACESSMNQHAAKPTAWRKLDSNESGDEYCMFWANPA